MNVNDLRVNQLIEVEMEYNGQRVVLSSRIEGIERDCILIATPIHRGEPLMMSSGFGISIQFRLRGTLWEFRSEIMGKRWLPIPVWIIKKPLEFIKVAQNRNWVRLDVTLPLHFKYLDRDDDTTYKVFTVDISAGGLLFSGAYDCNAGERLKIDLFLTEKNPVSLLGRVVRTFDKDQEALRGYRVAVEFEDITESQRDHIFKFVFDKQRQNIRRGLLK